METQSQQGTTMERYTIQFVSKLTGLNPHTIRAWEKRYQSVTPARNDTGRRIYSQKDVERLNFIKELAALGQPLKELSGYKTEELGELYQKYFAENGPVQAVQKENLNELDGHMALQHLFIALYDYKLDVIAHEIEKLVKGLDERKLCLTILSPIFTEIAQQMNHGKITIAQEHGLSAIIKFHIGSAIYRNYKFKPASRFKIALAAPEGEYHEFGIICAALLCSYYKKDFFYLGPNLPGQSLAEATNGIEANIIILGLTAFSFSNPETQKRYILSVLDKIAPDAQLWIGGSSKINPEDFSNHPNVKLMPSLNVLDNALANL